MTVKGLDSLNRKLAKLPQVSKDRIREALAQSAREITNLMENLAPEDSGLLKGSIGWTWGAPPRGAVTLGTVERGDLTLTIYAGDEDAYYIRFLEFGTLKMAAQPFFYPAFRALRRRAKTRIARQVSRGLKQVANG